ncbi:MAG: DUF4421 family protein [Bacteroidota bacterium]
MVDGTSTFYTKYRNKFIVSYFQSYLSYGVEINQKLVKDTDLKSNIKYVSESTLISGLEINYDKINFQISFKSPINEINAKTKGKTKYRNLVLKIGGNRWILENSYRKYSGFYNQNTARYDTGFIRTGIYNQLPDLSLESFKAKFLFFTNSNKFSFKSTSSGSYRQLKSAFSFVLVASIYLNRINSDSSFIPFKIRNFYDNYQTINGLNTFALSGYGGGSLNLVIWKALFANITLVIGPEWQWRNYKYMSNRQNQQLFYLSVSGDTRFSLGLNFKTFFFLFNGSTDYAWYNGGQISLLSRFNSVNFSLGFRIGTKTPKVYRKFQSTNFYQKL